MYGAGSPVPGSLSPCAAGRFVLLVNVSLVGVRDNIIQAGAPPSRLDALTPSWDVARARISGGRVLAVMSGLVAGLLLPASLLLAWWRRRRHLRGVGALSRIRSRVVLWLYWWYAAVLSHGVGQFSSVSFVSQEGSECDSWWLLRWIDVVRW